MSLFINYEDLRKSTISSTNVAGYFEGHAWKHSLETLVNPGDLDGQRGLQHSQAVSSKSTAS